MKRLFWVVAGIMGLCMGCAGASQTSSGHAETQVSTGHVQDENVASGASQAVLPPVAKGDIRIEVVSGGAVVDAHCERQHVTVHRVDQGKKELMFEADADLMGVMENAEGFVDAVDINFDGYMDILVPHAVGAHNAYHRAWVWDHESQKYIEIPEFKELGSCSFKPESKEIHVFTHISAASYTEAIWQLQDKQLKRKLLISVAPDQKNAAQFSVEVVKTVNDQDVRTVQSVSEDELSAAVKQAYATK